MKAQLKFRWIISIIIIILFVGCNKDEQPEEEYFNLTENDFLFIPQKPKAAQDVDIITYDCGYNEFASLKIEGTEIELKKRFNGQLKWPCILEHDTISLGKLNQGTYNVTFLLIDTNPFMAPDSVFLKEEKELIVSN